MVSRSPAIVPAQRRSLPTSRPGRSAYSTPRPSCPPGPSTSHASRPPPRPVVLRATACVFLALSVWMIPGTGMSRFAPEPLEHDVRRIRSGGDLPDRTPRDAAPSFPLPSPLALGHCGPPSGAPLRSPTGHLQLRPRLPARAETLPCPGRDRRQPMNTSTAQHCREMPLHSPRDSPPCVRRFLPSERRSTPRTHPGSTPLPYSHP